MKSKLKGEFKLNCRYAVAGIVNTLIGLGVILGLTMFEVKPTIANFLGYAISLMFAFFVSKRFVFRSEGHITSEFIRYLCSFILSYIVNILTLYVCISWYFIGPISSQVMATLSYIITMYLITRLFVFNHKIVEVKNSVK